GAATQATELGTGDAEGVSAPRDPAPGSGAADDSDEVSSRAFCSGGMTLASASAVLEGSTSETDGLSGSAARPSSVISGISPGRQSRFDSGGRCVGVPPNIAAISTPITSLIFSQYSGPGTLSFFGDNHLEKRDSETPISEAHFLCFLLDSDFL